jgi:glycine/sarcosine N-methyltransferase
MYHHLADHYDTLFPIDQHIKPFLKGFVHSQGKALDLGCGTGRMTQIIHDFGMEVIGIDLDEKMIEVARQRHPDVMFKVQNMMDAFIDKNYDLITCFGNTLPHLDENSLDHFFELLSKHLSKQGVMIIQMLNYDQIMTNQPKSLKTIEKPGIIFERNYAYFADHIVFETRLTLEETTQIGFNILYPHQQSTLIKLIQKHHLIPTFLSVDLKSLLKPNEPYFTLLVQNP